MTRTDAGPLNADWRWAPSGWISGASLSGDSVAPGVALFHDDDDAALNAKATPSGVDLTVTRFEGNFLSLAIDLPEAARTGLAPWHQISAEIEVPLPGFLRLNLKTGSVVTPRLRGFEAGRHWVGLDLDRAFPPDRAFEHAWLDLILEGVAPGTHSISVHQVRRHPRPAM